MRVRIPYCVEKEEAWLIVVEAISYMESCSATNAEVEIYKAEVLRLCRRYGLMGRLKEQGHDLAEVLPDRVT